MKRSSISGLALVATLLASVAVTHPLAIAQEASPAAGECAASTPEENTALVNQVYEAIGAGDDDALAGLMSEDLEYYTPSKGEREGNLADVFRGQEASFPDATVTVDLVVAEGDLVAAYTTWSGTAAGETATLMGQEVSIPAGATSEWATTVFFRIECGKIAEVWPLPDRLGQLVDLGVITDEDLQVQGVASAATPAP